MASFIGGVMYSGDTTVYSTYLDSQVSVETEEIVNPHGYYDDLWKEEQGIDTYSIDPVLPTVPGFDWSGYESGTVEESFTSQQADTDPLVNEDFQYMWTFPVSGFTEPEADVDGGILNNRPPPMPAMGEYGKTEEPSSGWDFLPNWLWPDKDDQEWAGGDPVGDGLLDGIVGVMMPLVLVMSMFSD